MAPLAKGMTYAGANSRNELSGTLCIILPSGIAQLVQLSAVEFLLEKMTFPVFWAMMRTALYQGRRQLSAWQGKGQLSIPYTYLEPVCFLYIYTKPPKVPYSRRISILLTLRKARPREPRG